QGRELETSSYCDQPLPDTRDQVDKRHPPFRATYCARHFRSCDNEMYRANSAIPEAWEVAHFPQPRSRHDFLSTRVGYNSIPGRGRDLLQSEFQVLACIPGVILDRAQVDTRLASIRFGG